MLYHPYQPDKIIQVDTLYSLHYFNFKENYHFPGEKHDFWELVCVDMGGATIGDDDIALPLGPGQCCLHAPNVFHTIQTNPGSRAGLFVISFQSDCQALHELCRRPLQLNTECRRIIRRILMEAREFCGPVLDITNQQQLKPTLTAPYGSGQLILLNLQLLLLLLLRSDREDGDTGPKRAPITEEQDMQSTVAAAENFMRSHLDGSIRLDDICRNVGVSRTTLKRLFRQCLESGVMEHYQSLRLKEACRYLRTGRVNISQVAYELGYSSLPAFSRQFKQVLGITPREYTLLVNDSLDTAKRPNNKHARLLFPEE